MAEKNDHDDEKDEKDADGEEEEAEEKAAPADKKAAPVDKKAAVAAKKDDDDSEDEDEDEDEDDEEEEAKPAAKPVAKASSTKPVAKRTSAPLAKAKATTPPRKGGSLGKSMILFVVIVGGLAAAFALLGQESSSGPAAPKWKTGETPDLELTVIPEDKKNLACASTEEIEGKHCAFEEKAKAWSKGDSTDDKKLLKPYTTVDHVQVLAAGLWSDPGMTGTLPTARFSVKCKYKVEGKTKTAAVRWAIDGQWYDSKDLYTGSISGCKIVQ